MAALEYPIRFLHSALQTAEPYGAGHYSLLEEPQTPSLGFLRMFWDRYNDDFFRLKYHVLLL